MIQINKIEIMDDDTKEIIKNYYPSNSVDGDYFEITNCDKCYKKSFCSILTNAYVGKRPKQWIYNDENLPTCTSLNTNRPKSNHKQIDYPQLF